MKNKLILGQVSFFVFIRVILHTATSMLMPLLPVFSRGLGIDITMAGRAFSISQLSNLFVPFISAFSEHKGHKFGMVLGLSTFALGGAVMLLWQSYTAFVIATFVMTLGTFVFLPVMQSYIGEEVPYQRRGSIIAFSEFGWAASFIFGVPLISLLISHYGWLAPYPAFFVIMLILIAIIVLTFPASKRPHNGESVFAGMKYVFSSRKAWLGILVGFLLITGVNMIGVVYGYWLEDVYHLDVEALGISSVVIGFASAIGVILVASITDKVGKRRAIVGGLALNSLVAGAIVFITPAFFPALVWIFVFYISMEFSLVSSLTMLTELMPEHRTPFLAAVTAAQGFGGAFGAYIGPYLYQSGFSVNVFGCIIIDIAIIVLILIIKPKSKPRWLDD